MTIPSTLLRACGRGNQEACAIARKISAMYAASVLSFSDIPKKDDHPNKLPFQGTLLIVDQASNKPPHGSSGHRIFVPKKVAANKLEGLIGMAVNYDTGDLAEHATRHKVGVITRAWLEDSAVKVSGFVWKKDFPESVRDLSKKKDLGMSMELADVYVRDENESVWHLDDFEFTGATILKKDSAAYTNTSLAAKAAALSEEGEKMAKDKDGKKKRVAAAPRDTGQDNGTTALMAQAISGSIGPAIAHALAPVVSEIKASNERTMDAIAELNGRFTLQAAAAEPLEDEDDDEIVLSAAKEEDDSDENDMAAASDSSDEDDMEAAGDDDASDDESSDEDGSDLAAMEDLELDDPSMEPGEVNKDSSSKGSKTTVTKPPKQGEHFPGNVAKGRVHSAAGKKGTMKAKKPFPGVHASNNIEAAAVQIQTLHAQNRKLRRAVLAAEEKRVQDTRKMKTQIKTMSASLERFAELESRRSVMPVELVNLASKAGVNLGEIKASGQKIGVDAVDSWFAAAKNQGINIPPDQRIAMKMLLEEHGMLDQGVIDRGYGRAN